MFNLKRKQPFMAPIVPQRLDALEISRGVFFGIQIDFFAVRVFKNKDVKS